MTCKHPQTWPADALEMVAHKSIEDMAILAGHQDSIVLICKHFHISAKTLADKFGVDIDIDTI